MPAARTRWSPGWSPWWTRGRSGSAASSRAPASRRRSASRRGSRCLRRRPGRRRAMNAIRTSTRYMYVSGRLIEFSETPTTHSAARRPICKAISTARPGSCSLTPCPHGEGSGIGTRLLSIAHQNTIHGTMRHPGSRIRSWRTAVVSGAGCLEMEGERDTEAWTSCLDGLRVR